MKFNETSDIGLLFYTKTLFDHLILANKGFVLVATV